MAVLWVTMPRYTDAKRSTGVVHHLASALEEEHAVNCSGLLDETGGKAAACPDAVLVLLTAFASPES